MKLINKLGASVLAASLAVATMGISLQPVLVQAQTGTTGTEVLTVTSPSADQAWVAGTTQTISWTEASESGVVVSPQPPAAVDVELEVPSSASGTAPYQIAVAVPDTGSYTWTIPPTMSSSYLGQMVIAVMRTDSSGAGTSSPFTLQGAATTPPSSAGSVSSPVSGAQWGIGTTQAVTWAVTATPTVPNVTLVLVGQVTGEPMYTIAANVPNSGTYSWTINSDMNGSTIPSGQYVLEVVNSENNLVVDTSPVFSLTQGTPILPPAAPTGPAPTISSLNPNLGLVGTLVLINGTGFTATGNTVNIESGVSIPNLNSNSGTLIDFVLPSQSIPQSTAQSGTFTQVTPGTYNVSVTNVNGTSGTIPFTVTAAPGEVVPTPTSPVTSTPTPVATQPTATVELVKTPDSSTVYVLNGNTLTPFDSAEVFAGLGYQDSQVQTIQDSQFSTYFVSPTPEPAPIGSLIRAGDNPTVYLVVTNGKKSAIPSMNTLSSLGLNPSSIIVLSDQDIQSYPDSQRSSSSRTHRIFLLE